MSGRHCQLTALKVAYLRYVKILEDLALSPRA